MTAPSVHGREMGSRDRTIWVVIEDVEAKVISSEAKALGTVVRSKMGETWAEL